MCGIYERFGTNRCGHRIDRTATQGPARDTRTSNDWPCIYRTGVRVCKRVRRSVMSTKRGPRWHIHFLSAKKRRPMKANMSAMMHKADPTDAGAPRDMDALPPELVCCIVERVDVLTLPVLRCVAPQWLDLVDLLRLRLKHKARSYERADATHACTLRVRCAMRYAQRLTDLGRWNLLEWVRDLATGDLDGLAKLHRRTCIKAASEGDLQRMQIEGERPVPARAYRRAARYGHLHILERALDGRDAGTLDICKQAAKGGHLHVLQWAVSNGLVKNSDACTCAARYGRFEVLKWAHQHGFKWGRSTCAAAAVRGDLEMLQWLRAGGCPWNWFTCARAAEHGHLHVLKWAHAQGCPLDSSTCSWASESGHLHIIKWARDHGCPWTEWTCLRAAGAGHLPLLQWARANGCPWDARACSQAASGGHLHVLKWLRAGGCPWDARTCCSAARNGHLDVLMWARTNGCAWDSDVMRYAAMRGHVPMLEWAHANGCFMPDVSRTAACRGRLDALEWTIAKKFTWDKDLYLEAADRGHLSILELLKSHRCPMPERPRSLDAISEYHAIREWFAREYAIEQEPQHE